MMFDSVLTDGKNVTHIALISVHEFRKGVMSGRYTEEVGHGFFVEASFMKEGVGFAAKGRALPTPTFIVPQDTNYVIWFNTKKG